MQRTMTEVELDMLLLFYTLSDQYGNVDVARTRTFFYQHYGILLPNQQICLKPHHVQALVDHGMIPDVNDTLARIKNLEVKEVAAPTKRRRAPRRKIPRPLVILRFISCPARRQPC